MRIKDRKKLKVEAKRHLILECIAKGMRYTDIVNKFSKEWDVSPKTIEVAIHDATEYMRSEGTKENLIAANMERLDSIISDSMQEGDRKNAVKAIDTQNKMLSAYEQKVKLETDADIVLNFEF